MGPNDKFRVVNYQNDYSYVFTPQRCQSDGLQARPVTNDLKVATLKALHGPAGVIEEESVCELLSIR